MLEVRLFGETEVRTADGRILGLRDFGGVKPREIFEVLALHLGRVVTKSVLADLVWEGEPPADGLATLESYVCVLRKRLEPGVPARDSAIVTVTGGYRLREDRVRTDLDQVDALLSRAAEVDPESALTLTLRALELARGTVLEHAPYATWAQSTRRGWADRVTSALVRAAGAALELGDDDRAVQLAGRALRADVLAEDAWRHLMRAHWGAGRRGAALRAYEECRDHLAETLGVDPSPETQRLFTTMLQQRDGVDEPRPVLQREVSEAVAAVIGLVTYVHAPTATAQEDAAATRDAALLLDLLGRAGVPLAWPQPSAPRPTLWAG